MTVHLSIWDNLPGRVRARLFRLLPADRVFEADNPAVLDRLLRCRSGEAWDNESARTWWEHHLADVAGVAAAAPVGGFEPALV